MTLFTDDIFAAAHAVSTAPAPAGLDSTWLTMSKALTTDHPIDVPGLVRPFLPHQAAGFAYLQASLAKWGFGALGHDMGLGKTQMFLAAAALALHQATTPNPYVILVGPPVAKAGYMGDLQACFPHLRFVHLTGRSPMWTCTHCGEVVLPDGPGLCGEAGAHHAVLSVPPADIYFLSDDPQTLKAWFVTVEKTRTGGEAFHANGFVTGAAMLIRDESHRDKGNMGDWAKSLRAKVMVTVGKALQALNVPRIMATGTMLTNRVIEAYVPLLAYGGPEVLMALTPGASKPETFKWRYCDPQQKSARGRQYTDMSGNNLGEVAKLNEYLRMCCYARIEKSDLGDDVLPHSGWDIRPIALNGGVMGRYLNLEQDFLNTVLAEDGPEAYYRKSRMAAVQQMMALWEEAGKAKAPAATEYVADLVDQGRKVVVFFNHQAVRDAIATWAVKHGISYSVIDGKVTGDDRIDVIRDFQDSADGADIVLCQHQAAGIAVTLTAARDAVFVQVPWSAGILKQCADRILRVDDRTKARAAAGERVTWHVLQAAHGDGRPTFDMAMWDVLERKAMVCDAVNAGKPVTMRDEDVYLAALQAWFPQARGNRP